MKYYSKYMFFAGALFAILNLGGCDNDAVTADNALERLCMDTGGVIKDHRCVCEGVTCDANMVCAEDGHCPVNLSSLCDHKEKKCSGSVTYECVENVGWTQIEKCEKGCADDGKKCAQCFETSCKDGVLTQCNDNIATTISCEHGCNDAADDCKPECEAGQVKCDGKDRLECNPDTLTWRSVEKCDVLCDINKAGQTRCIDDCESGATRCFDGKLTTCIDKIWSAPVACELNNRCYNAEKCIECDSGSQEKRCINDVDGVAHIQVCNGNYYEDELIPEDISDPNSAKVANISREGYSCKEDKIEFGDCNNLAEAFCEDKKNADNRGVDLGIMYSCKDGLKVEESKCWDEDDPTTRVSCNADKTGCGICYNNDSKGCQNDEHGVGNQIKCVNGEWQETQCNRGLACRDEKNCRQCNYNAIDTENEKICSSNRRNEILVCQKDYTWGSSTSTCQADPNGDKFDDHCKQGSREYHDYCPGGHL